jgi:hypothetical protein
VTNQNLEVAFFSENDAKSFFEGQPLGNGTVVSVQGNDFALVDYQKNKGFGLETVIGIAVHLSQSVAEGVATHFIVDWLVRKLSPSAKFVRYKGETYHITEKDMSRLLEALEDE